MRSTSSGWRWISSRPGVGRLWRVCTPGKCQGKPLHPCLWGQFALGTPKCCWHWAFLVSPRFSADPQGQLQLCCPTTDLSWAGTQTLENSPAQLNGPRFALLRVRNHWALFLFLHKGLRAYFALKAVYSPKDFSHVEYREWAGTEGGIALELSQAKDNEAPLSPVQWFSHTLSFKVSWDVGMSRGESIRSQPPALTRIPRAAPGKWGGRGG